MPDRALGRRIGKCRYALPLQSHTLDLDKSLLSGLALVHVKNTGRCRELLTDHAKVYLERSRNETRSTTYDLLPLQSHTLDLDKSLLSGLALHIEVET